MQENLSPILSPAQIDCFRKKAGEDLEAAVGDVLYDIGDRGYPFIVILEGEAVVEDGAGNEIVRHGANGFLGEVSLLSGQTVYLRARATEPMRYLAIDRDKLRWVLGEDEPLSDLILTTFNRRREALQKTEGIGFEVIGPRTSPDTRRIIDFATRNRLPHQWLDPERNSPELAPLVQHKDPEDFPFVRLPGGTNLCKPTNGQLSRALGIGLELDPVETVDLVVIGGGPAGLGAAVYGASEGLNTLVVERSALGGQAGTSRRIENYLGFPAGISGNELTSRAITQARKFGARTATPYRSLSLEPSDGGGPHIVHLEDDRRVEARCVVIATGADYRRLPVDNLREYEGISIFYAAGPPEARNCGGDRVGIVGGGNSAAQAAIWLARGGAQVKLMHRRSDLSETMSHYLISDLERHAVKVCDNCEIAQLHGSDGDLEEVTLKSGERFPLGFLFLFLGAEPCTHWLPDEILRDEKGFVLTGQEAGAEGLYETSVEGIFAAGDVRAGSTKRCATAVGEGAAVVRYVHERFSAVPA